MKILIVAEHASAAFGGEAALPLHYFRLLRRRGYEVWLLVHERTRDELRQMFGSDPRIIFMPVTVAVRVLWRLGSLLPQRLADFSTGYLMRILTQRRQVVTARRLIADAGLEIVHQPMPVSPREPSLLYGLTVPVVIGPMNGGMDFPPAFRARSSRFESWAIAAGRAMTDVMNGLFPGKRQAAAILVANDHTRQVLPSGIRGRVIKLPENGVDLAVWKPIAPLQSPDSAAHTRFVFVGRLVGWKAVDLLLEAFKRASLRYPMSLLIIGDGSERQSWRPGLRNSAFCRWTRRPAWSRSEAGSARSNARGGSPSGTPWSCRASMNAAAPSSSNGAAGDCDRLGRSQGLSRPKLRHPRFPRSIRHVYRRHRRSDGKARWLA